MSVGSFLRSAVGPAMLLCVSTSLADAPTRVRAFGRLPLTFEKNTGRYDKRVQFLARMGGATVFITNDEMVMVLRGKPRAESPEPRAESPEPRAESPEPRAERQEPRAERQGARAAAPSVPSPRLRGEGQGEGLGRLSARSPQPSAVLRMKLVGANAKAVAAGLTKQPGIVNYFIGNDPSKWRTRVPTYAKAKLAEVYPGVDVVYYGTEPRAKSQEPRARAVGRSLSALSSQLSALEYDFILHPGADPKRIRLAFEGADRIRVADGDLILSTPAGDVRVKRPYAYQTVGGKRVQVACDYALRRGSATLRLARYDTSRPLVVDPVVEFMTYFGGSSYENAHGVATDATGSAYITGQTESMDFPTTFGVYDPAMGGPRDVFVAKFNPSGSSLAYSTYLGGTSFGEYGYGIAVDGAGCAYVTGEARTDFPTTPFAAQTSDPGLATAFVTKLNAAGSSLVYSTLCGGSDDDFGYGIAVDGSGAAHICGHTKSSGLGTAGAYDVTSNGAGDAFVAKVSPSGSSFAYRTYLGGAQGDTATAIAVVGGGAFVTGYTWSSGYPTSVGAYDTSHNGNADAFVTVLNSTGTALVYSTFLGSTADDWGQGIAADASGGAYVTGQTSGAYPTTAGAWDRTRSGDDCFVTKLDPSGASLAYSTYFGGGTDEIGYAISLWGQRACVTGYTGSTNLYCTADAYQSQHAGSWDAFVCILNEAGSGVLYSTYIGGSGLDIGYGISVNGQALSVAGWTVDSLKLPVYRALDATLGGSQDAWVLKLDLRERVATVTTVPAGQMGSSGAPVTIQAGLTRQSDSSPVSGATLAFGVGGTAVGSAVTNGAGVASLAYAVPPELGVGNGYYHIRAEFTGDAAYLGSVGSAPFISLPYSVDGQVTWNGAGLEWVTVTLEGETHIATYEASSSGRSVPDLGTVTSQIPMTWQGQIESVRVQVNMNHTYASDLRISVIHPDGTTVVLHDRGGWSLDYARSVYPDVVAPVQSLAAFTGKTANGTWTLKIEDMAAGDTGYLNSWYLAVTLRQTNPYDTSRSSGNYFFSPGAGTYTLRPWRDGYVFTPESRTVTVGPEQHNLDFVARVLTVLEANDAEGQSGSSVGLSARLTARGGWVADRTVTFTVDGSEAGGAVTDATGVATLAYEIPLSKGEGAYALGAAFAGDTAYVGSSDTATLTVLPPSDTTLYTIDRAGTITGLVILRQYDLKRLSDNAMLEGKTISFKIDGSEIGTSVTNAGGDSTLDWTITDGPATRTITAAFAGDAAYNGCSDDATLTCETWATKMSGVNREGKITAYRILKAWLWKMDNSPIPGKSIAFKLDGTLLGTDATRPTGVAQIGYTIADGAGAGARTILAEWAGDGGYLPSSCTNTLTVLKATPYIWVMPRSVPAGGVARFYAYFRRLADYQKQEAKTVTFKVDGTWVADVVTGSGADAGIARYSYTTIEPPGAHTIRCEFAGDAWVDAGYGEANLTIY